ncbi:hypothetical protein SS50377_26416 [Spironucleus salmonicida]|uniref:Uncharacterized protein n=1 Tax=Spironucleus salmonicida TaxID=348837 RepID=V6LSU9_9EUKA|nr:hypothetical protein SS50377_26416 [Spironucleus salmonicida]|eukprot:EST47717.1 hypothetical protein SS50377_12113 [Spironucleus salmonicida]
MSIQNFQEGHPLTSPRSLLACKRLGIDQIELQPLKLEEIQFRFKHLPPNFRKEAENALEEDRQAILIELIREHTNIINNGITLAEKVAFPDLSTFCKIASETSFTPSEYPKTQQDLRVKKQIDELNFISQSLDKTTNKDLRHSMNWAQLQKQNQEIREEKAYCLLSKTQTYLERSSSFRQQKRQKFEDKILSQQYNEKSDFFQEQKQLNLDKWDVHIQSQACKDEQFINANEMHKQRMREEYEIQVKEMERKKKLLHEDRVTMRQSQSKEAEKRVQSVQVQHQQLLKKKEMETKYRFEKLEQFQLQNSQKQKSQQNQNQLSFTAQKALRMRQIQENLLQQQQQKENKYLLFQQQQLIKEQQLQQQQKNFHQQKSSQMEIQNELRKRRMQRIQQKKDFGNFVKFQNDKFVEQQRIDQRKAAQEYKNSVLKKSYQNELSHDRSIEKLLDQQGNLNKFVKKSKSASKQPVKYCKQKVLVNNYLLDPEVVKKGFVEIKKQGWTDGWY